MTDQQAAREWLVTLRKEAQSLLDYASKHLDHMADMQQTAAYDWWLGRRDTLVELLEKLEKFNERSQGIPAGPATGQRRVGDGEEGDDILPSSCVLESPEWEAERKKAVADAIYAGIRFMVNGRHVPSESVQITSRPTPPDSGEK